MPFSDVLKVNSPISFEVAPSYVPSMYILAPAIGLLFSSTTLPEILVWEIPNDEINKIKNVIWLSVYYHNPVILAITSLSKSFSSKYLLFNL